MTRYPKQGKGRKWTIKELAAIDATWRGDTISDGHGLSGEVRVASDGAITIRFKYAYKSEGKGSWHQCGTWPVRALEAIRAEREARSLGASWRAAGCVVCPIDRHSEGCMLRDRLAH